LKNGKTIEVVPRREIMKKLFSWFLRLGVLIVLAAIAWVIYVNLQQQPGHPVEEQAAQPQQQPAPEEVQPATPSESASPTPAPQPEGITATTDTPAADTAEVPQPPAPTESTPPAVTVELPTTEPAAEAEQPAEQEILAVAEQPATAPSEPAPAPAVEGETMQPSAEAAPEQAVAQSPEPAAIAAPAPATESATEQPATLQEARMAAWKGQWDKAESGYRKLQQENPDDFNVHGELGNLYYMQRKGKEAAEAYYQAATLLAAQGYRRDAMRLMQVIQRLDPELGAKLQQELFGSGSDAAAPSTPGRTPSYSP
jgi:tetratricopeptide (TPR) repeat protein